jgi:hypothetical protein
MNCSSGGGVAYIGPVTYDWPFVSHNIYVNWASFVFDVDGLGDYAYRQAGKALALVMESFPCPPTRRSTLQRTLHFTMMYLGDPQMLVFTEVPDTFSITAPCSLGQEVDTFTVRIQSDFGPPCGARITLSQEGTVLCGSVLTKSDHNGEKLISIPGGFPSPGEALLVVTHDTRNFFRKEQFIQIESGCDAFPGDANASGGVDIDDVVYLIAFVFSGGPPPVPYLFASGDSSCDCWLDIDDIVYLIDYIFSDGPDPCICDDWVAACGLPLR